MTILPFIIQLMSLLFPNRHLRGSANVQKSTAYRAFETSRTAHDTQSTINKVAHAHKRRVISQAFSNSAIRSFENHVLEHVNAFIAYLTPADENADESDKILWSPSANMAQLCKLRSSLCIKPPNVGTLALINI